MEPTTTAGIALLSLVGIGLAAGTTLAAVLLRRLHLAAQSDGTSDARQDLQPSGPVAEYRA